MTASPAVAELSQQRQLWIDKIIIVNVLGRFFIIHALLFSACVCVYNVNRIDSIRCYFIALNSV